MGIFDNIKIDDGTSTATVQIPFFTVKTIEQLAKALEINRKTFYRKKLKYKDYAQLLSFAGEYLKLRNSLGMPVQSQELIIYGEKPFNPKPDQNCDGTTTKVANYSPLTLETGLFIGS